MKKVKFVLPGLAFVFAIVASFASVNAKETLATVDVSKPSPSACSKVGTCNEEGTTLCNDGSVNVVRLSAGTCGSTFNGSFN